MSLLDLPATWVIQDVVVLVATACFLWFEQRNEQYRGQRLLEFFAFCFLDAAVFENGAVMAGRYGYGRSLMMLGAVPFTVPALEFMVLIYSLRLLEKMRLPGWTRPFLVGFFGMLQDFTLDPLAVRQVFVSEGHAIGRWSWYFASGDATLFGVPVYNFPGWVLILGIGSAFLLLGRWWYARSGQRPWVGVVAPVAAAVAALVVLVLPTSSFLLWLAPFHSQGSRAEWVMLGVHFAVPLLLLALVWRGRMLAPFSFVDDWPTLLWPAAFHVMDIGFALAGGFKEIIPLQLGVTALHLGVVGLVWWLSRAAAAAGTRTGAADALPLDPSGSTT